MRIFLVPIFIMLYTVLSPLIFFLSFAGIILVVSRVVLRGRRIQFSRDVRGQAESTTSATAEQFLHTGNNSVQLLKSRLGLALATSKQAVTDVKSSWENYQLKRAEKKALAQVVSEPVKEEQPTQAGGVTVPVSNWRENAITGVKNKLQTMMSLTRQLKNKARTRFIKADVPSGVIDNEPTQDSYVAERPKTQIKIMRVQAPEIVADEVGQGRFIAQLQKAQPPKSSVVEQAMTAITGLQYDKAEEILVPYLADHTKDTQAYMLLGKVALARENWDEASEIFQQVAHINPSAQEVQASLGLCALKQGKFTLAIQSLQKALRADPQNITVLEQLLAIAKRMDNRILQKSVLEQLAELQPENEQVVQDLQHVKQRESHRA